MTHEKLKGILQWLAAEAKAGEPDCDAVAEALSRLAICMENPVAENTVCRVIDLAYLDAMREDVVRPCFTANDVAQAKRLETALAEFTSETIRQRIERFEAWVLSLFPDGLPAEGEYSRLCFRHRPNVVVLVPTKVLSERELTVEEAMAEFPYLEVEG